MQNIILGVIATLAALALAVTEPRRRDCAPSTHPECAGRQR